MIDFLMVIFAKYIIYVLFLIAIVVFLKQERRTQKNMLIFIFITFPLAFLISRIVSSLFYNPRPFVLGHFTPLIPHATDNGFPSDHALLSFTLAFSLFVFKKRIGILFFVLGFLVSASRVYAGVHSPIDVFGSLMISIVVGCIVYIATKEYAHSIFT